MKKRMWHVIFVLIKFMKRIYHYISDNMYLTSILKKFSQTLKYSNYIYSRLYHVSCILILKFLYLFQVCHNFPQANKKSHCKQRQKYTQLINKMCWRIVIQHMIGSEFTDEKSTLNAKCSQAEKSIKRMHRLSKNPYIRDLFSISQQYQLPDNTLPSSISLDWSYQSFENLLMNKRAEKWWLLGWFQFFLGDFCLQ